MSPRIAALGALIGLPGCWGSSCPEPGVVYLHDGTYVQLGDLPGLFGETGGEVVVAGDEVVLTYEQDGRQVEVRWAVVESSLD